MKSFLKSDEFGCLLMIIGTIVALFLITMLAGLYLKN